MSDDKITTEMEIKQLQSLTKDHIERISELEAKEYPSKRFLSLEVRTEQMTREIAELRAEITELREYIKNHSEQLNELKGQREWDYQYSLAINTHIQKTDEVLRDHIEWHKSELPFESMNDGLDNQLAKLDVRSARQPVDPCVDCKTQVYCDECDHMEKAINSIPKKSSGGEKVRSAAHTEQFESYTILEEDDEKRILQCNKPKIDDYTLEPKPPEPNSCWNCGKHGLICMNSARDTSEPCQIWSARSEPKPRKPNFWSSEKTYNEGFKNGMKFNEEHHYHEDRLPGGTGVEPREDDFELINYQGENLRDDEYSVVKREDLQLLYYCSVFGADPDLHGEKIKRIKEAYNIE